MFLSKLFFISIFFAACSFQYELPITDMRSCEMNSCIDSAAGNEGTNILNMPINPAYYENTCDGIFIGNILTIPKSPKKDGQPSSVCKTNVGFSILSDIAKNANGKYLKVDINYLSKNYAGTFWHDVTINNRTTKVQEWALYSDVFKIIAYTDHSNYILGAIGGYDKLTDPEKNLVGFFKLQFDSSDEQLKSINIDFSNLYSHSGSYDSDGKSLPNEFFQRPTTFALNSVQIVDHP